MNIVRFNDPFACVAEKEGADFFKRACIAPLFLYDSPHNRDVFLQKSLAPFPFFRLACRSPDDDAIITPTGMAVGTADDIRKVAAALELFPQRFYGGGFEAFVLADADDKPPRSYVRFPKNDRFTIMRVQPTHRDGKMVYNAESFDAANPKLGWQPFTDDPEEQETASMFGAGVAWVLGSFFYDCALPSNYIASVSPAAQQHRSVEWLRARTHYTLITHGHPANRATVRQGDRVRSDRARELIRIAHARRAHLRTLRHERFTYARGRQIPVRATWVGPKEWKDEGGKQIYRLLDPVGSRFYERFSR
jgi:hypothetical protein